MSRTNARLGLLAVFASTFFELVGYAGGSLYTLAMIGWIALLRTRNRQDT